MNGNFPRIFVVLAFSAALLASALLGMVVEFNLRSNNQGTSSVPRVGHVTLIVQGDLTLGPDNKTHDSFVPSSFSVYAGQVVNLTILNYDLMPHSFSSPALGVDFQISASQTNGVPAVSQFQFSESNAGVYRWWCSIPCDSDAGEWAMTTGTDGQPSQIGYMGGFVTVLQG